MVVCFNGYLNKTVFDIALLKIGNHRFTVKHIFRTDGLVPYDLGGFYSLLRWILPEMVFGSSVRNSTILGYL